MSYPRLDSAGGDFTVTKWNNLATYLEQAHNDLIGFGIVDGLELGIGTGLFATVTSGTLNAKSCVTVSNIPDYACPPSSTVYLWINEDGAITTTTNTVFPGGSYVCMGRVTTDGSSVTEISRINRQEILLSLQEMTQAGGQATIALSGTSPVVLTPAEYGKRLLVFTGVLGSGVTVYLPETSGSEWTISDQTTGAGLITIRTETSTGLTLVKGKFGKFVVYGTTVTRVTADVP